MKKIAGMAFLMATLAGFALPAGALARDRDDAHRRNEREKRERVEARKDQERRQRMNNRYGYNNPYYGNGQYQQPYGYRNGRQVYRDHDRDHDGDRR